MAIIKPLYGHTSEETAYVVDDYPYSFSLRCTMKFWIEKHPKKGFRLVRRSQNPKNLRWNKEHKSTYSLVAGNLYLDENDHVHWSGLSEYSDVEKVKEFVDFFPQADLSVVRDWVIMKALYEKKILSTGILFGQPLTEADKERHQKELGIWESLKETLK